VALVRTLNVGGRQGRGEVPAFHTRRVQEEDIFIAGLHTEDGGHVFQGGCVFPIEAEDAPAATDDWSIKAMWFLGVLFFACLSAFFIAVLNASRG
jgi:hypothetical protein